MSSFNEKLNERLNLEAQRVRQSIEARQQAERERRERERVENENQQRLAREYKAREKELRRIAEDYPFREMLRDIRKNVWRTGSEHSYYSNYEASRRISYPHTIRRDLHMADADDPPYEEIQTTMQLRAGVEKRIGGDEISLVAALHDGLNFQDYTTFPIGDRGSLDRMQDKLIDLAFSSRPKT